MLECSLFAIILRLICFAKINIENICQPFMFVTTTEAHIKPIKRCIEKVEGFQSLCCLCRCTLRGGSMHWRHLPAWWHLMKWWRAAESSSWLLLLHAATASKRRLQKSGNLLYCWRFPLSSACSKRTLNRIPRQGTLSCLLILTFTYGPKYSWKCQLFWGRG